MNLICKFPVRGLKPTKTLLKVLYILLSWQQPRKGKVRVNYAIH